jgi:putative endonuclease
LQCANRAAEIKTDQECCIYQLVIEDMSSPSGITEKGFELFKAFFAFKPIPMAFLYILFSEKLDKYYVGACTDLDRRLYEHNIGHSKFTKTGMPWFVKYTEEYDDLASAKKRERHIKQQKSRKYIEELILKGRASRF